MRNLKKLGIKLVSTIFSASLMSISIFGQNAAAAEIKTIESCEHLYNAYLDLHRSGVKDVYNKLKELACEWAKEHPENKNPEHPFVFILKNESTLDENIENHDMSKYGEEEYNAYRKVFYPVDAKEKSDVAEEFQKALSHHMKTNPHHWQYWRDLQQSGSYIDKNEYKIALVEKVCDWCSMSRMMGNRMQEYFNTRIKFEEPGFKFAEPFLYYLMNVATEDKLDISKEERKMYLAIQNEVILKKSLNLAQENNLPLNSN